MKVTVCFDNVRVVVPCDDGTLLVRELMHKAILRYKKATGKSDNSLAINSLSSLTGGGILDPDDRLCDVADDREQIVAHFASSDGAHAGGDGASSVGTTSPDFFHGDGTKEHRYVSGNMKRESSKRLSMHVFSTREPCLTTYSAQSLPRESRRREPLGQDSKSSYDGGEALAGIEAGEIREVVIKNEAGPLGLHVVPCYDLLGNDRGLRVEGIEPTGRIAKDGQVDLHDTIVKINGHNLLHIPFTKVQEIFRTCMNEPCLKISVVKSSKRKPSEKSKKSVNEKAESEEGAKRLQCSNYNLLQTANTRKIGRMIEIDLTKGSNGLGFSVTTRDNPAGGHCPIYIKNILPKGAAVEDARLKPGDRLLEVNKMEMTGKSQTEVVALLRNVPPGGKVKLLVSRQEDICSNTSTDMYVSQDLEVSREWKNLPPTPLTIKTEDAQDLVNPHYETCSYKAVPVADNIVLSPRKNRIILALDIPVHDSEKAGLGVSVKGKTSSADDSSNVDLGIFIKSVINGGAASRDGRLKDNDQLLNVNGVSLLGLSNSDAMETLRRAMLNTNSSVTGVITLTIARKVTSNNAGENASHQCKAESANSIYITDSSKSDGGGRVKENNNLNSQTETSPWNPVIDRLTEQYSKSLRNESYCIATNKTWIDSAKLTRHEEPLPLLEESSGSVNNDNIPGGDGKKSSEDKDSQYSEDPTYDSQLSLEEFNSATNKFSRDALGRQSMSEKRHAALDAKNTDTYKRNKKIRENRENKNAEDNKTAEGKNENLEEKKSLGGGVGGGVSLYGSRKHFEKKATSHVQPEYLKTIPGCNNKLATLPRKHWLVDDVVHGGEVSNSQQQQQQEGFSNSRGDVKQASLNSALDERYKRSRKKGGIRSMLRLGKNRKSLNFGDNIEARHETSNYCSGTINYIA